MGIPSAFLNFRFRNLFNSYQSPLSAFSWSCCDTSPFPKRFLHLFSSLPMFLTPFHSNAFPLRIKMRNKTFACSSGPIALVSVGSCHRTFFTHAQAITFGRNHHPPPLALFFFITASLPYPHSLPLLFHPHPPIFTRRRRSKRLVVLVVVVSGTMNSF